jgi:hypothetical protein
MNGVVHTGMLLVRRYLSCRNLIFFTGSLNEGFRPAMQGIRVHSLLLHQFFRSPPGLPE